MALPHWFVKLIMKLFPRRFFLAKFTRIPGIRKIAEELLFKDDEIYYLPLDSVISKENVNKKKIVINKKLEETIDLVIPSQVINHFIDKSKYRWVMNFCLCRTANNCEAYPHELGCLFLGEAVLDINPAYGKLVTKEEAKEHIVKGQKQGLIHLIGRNKIDSQWLNVGPGDKLLTICQCCECCCLWKMVPDVDVKISRSLVRMPGVSVNINDNCVACGDCTDEICIVNAITMLEKKAYINQNHCKGCGRCVTVCQYDAITMTIKNQNFVEETISNIANKVDVS